MNIYQLSNKTGLSLTNLRKLEKLGVLKLSNDCEKLSKLHFHMRGNQTFTLAMLLWLHDEPDLIEELGYISSLYEQRARRQIMTLGNAAGSLAPKEVTAAIADAARGDRASALLIGNWLKSILLDNVASHHWVAMRLLIPLNEFLREQSLSLIPLALLNMRKQMEFAGWWRSKKFGSAHQIFYAKPLDL